MANSKNHAAIGVWYNPRQCLRHPYESRPMVGQGFGNGWFWETAFQPSMRSMGIIVMLKIEQLRLEISRRPE